MATDWNKVITDVRICIDEIAANDSDSDLDIEASTTADADDDATDASTAADAEQFDDEMNKIIESKIDEALWYVYGNAQAELFSASTVQIASDTASATGGVVGVSLTNKMLRVIWAKLDSWPYAVSEIVAEGTDEEAMIKNAYCGATKERPALLMENRTNSRTLKFYKGNDSDTYTIAYLPRISKDDSGVTVDSNVYRAVIYVIASLVETTLNNKAYAAELMEVATTFMGITNK